MSGVTTINGSEWKGSVEAKSDMPTTPNDANAPSVLPGETQLARLMASGDVGEMIAAMILTSSDQARKSARASKEAAMAAEDAAQGHKIEAMEDAAVKRLVGGLADAAGTAANGAGQMGSKLSGHQQWSTYTGFASADMKVGSAVAGFAASMDDIEKEHAERALKQAGRDVQSAIDDDKDAKETIRKALSLLSDLQRAQNDAQKAAIFRS